MILDPESPYLAYNLARLEKRFLIRYNESLDNERLRKNQGKPTHKTTLKSIAENQERLENVQLIQRILLKSVKISKN